MTFLKKLGIILVKAAGVVSGLYPLVQPVLGAGRVQQYLTAVVNDFTLMVNQAVVIETALNGQPGVDKMKALIPLITNIVKTSEAVAGKKIADEAKFILGCQECAQGVVDILNSIDQDEAKQA